MLRAVSVVDQWDAGPWAFFHQMFFGQAARLGDAAFLWQKKDGKWASISWAEAAVRVAKLSEALKALGLAPGERVVLVSENRPEFCLWDLAIMAAGGITETASKEMPAESLGDMPR